ncbi:TylF/MycF/NovP-related O-methyltransferase [Candidatus Pelagibacter communis]|uniref:TylF/MycF/NovP-related O-methyltransferase n=1 Tax=Candidatus Pelagibacter TaxID=198251 RepID=UPI003EE2BCF6
MIKKIIKNFLNFFDYKIIKKDSWSQKVENLIVEASAEEINLYNKLDEISLTSIPNKWCLTQGLKHINNNNIEGDIVETGVFKGANLVIINDFINELNINKQVYAYDTYEGQPEPTKFDFDLSGKSMLKKYEEYKKQNEIPVFSSLDKVKNNLKKFSKFNFDKIKFIKGKVEDTLMDDLNIPKKISLLRLDTDFYESIKISLEILYPKVESGGVIIIDDYGHFKGAKLAVDDYFKNQTNIWMHRVDYTCRLIIKP